MDREEILDTTLGDLIVALTEETDRLVRNKNDAHILVAFILSDLFSHSVPMSQMWH